MSRKWKLILFLLLIGSVIIGGFLVRLPDPYHHDEDVNLWEWLYREYDELVHGEKE